MPGSRHISIEEFQDAAQAINPDTDALNDEVKVHIDSGSTL
jgi:hypothetical protein